MRSIRSLREGAVGCVLLSLCLSATGQAVLKPTDNNAIPLRTRALTAEIVIDQQFAMTHLTQTFQNQTQERTEADFLYTVPLDTIITSFAYWYGEEKVIAHIVEKEEAAAIYAGITSRMRDPALVEMVGKNTFRARIFPVMPLSDLKVEMTLMQALPSTSQGVSYRLPLRMEKGQSLDSLTIHAEIRKDAELVKVANSFGLPFTQDQKSYRLTLESKQYRPVSDLTISLFRKPNALRTALVTSPSGKGGGYFALALTPNETLERPQVHLLGTKLAALSPPIVRIFPAHHAAYLFGRYSGDDIATVTLSGTAHNRPWSASAQIALKANQGRSGVARQLWAARQIAAVSAGPGRNRATVIALSKTYGRPSKYTSWLAVPREESDNYWREKLEAQLQATVQQLIAVTNIRRMSSHEERAVYAQVKTLRHKLGEESDRIVSGAIQNIAEMLAQEKNAGKKIVYVYKGHDRYPAPKIIVDDPGRHPDPARLALLRRQLDLLAKASGRDVREAEREIPSAEIEWNQARSWQARDELFAEESKDRPDPARVNTLEKRFLALEARNYEKEFAVDRAKTLAVRADLERTERQLDLPATKADSKLTAELQKKKEALSQRYAEVRARVGDPLIQVEASEDAVQVVAVMPDGEIKRLEFNHASGRWEARFDIPTYATEGNYLIRIVIVQRDGMRHSLTFSYHVLLSPPSGRGEAQQISGSSNRLRLEMEASENTARVSALLPWGEKVELSPTSAAHRFLSATTIPEAFQNRAFAITFIITDRAHNRTVIRLDPTK